MATQSSTPLAGGSGSGSGGGSGANGSTQQTSQQQQPGQLTRSKSNTPSAALPVGLSEAALDSPTFRAVTVNFTEQLDTVERWLDNYTRATSRLVHDMLGLEDTINGYLSRMMPPASAPVAAAPSASDTATIATGLGAEGVIDADYTMLALRRTSDGARGWWGGILGTVRRLEPVSVEPIKQFVNGDMRTFKETRRALEQAQKSFDAALARYVSQSKTKEPSALREDAFAVYETRKLYLKASMDFCQMAPQLRFGLDKLLVRVCADLYKEMRRARESGGGVGGGGFSGSWGEELERIRGWTKEMEASEGVFRRELQLARRDIGEQTLALYKPSRELEDYSVSTVPYLGSRGPVNVQVQGKGAEGSEMVSAKQGWLFLRVLSGKPVRTTWVRRWYYCRNGIFGWLVQGPQGVLQGDEIGVLLCSAKPAVQEERRFCFEVKTKAQTLLLQAETQAQLIEWLEVFEAAKKKAFEASMGRDQSSLGGGVDPAFAITAPLIPEFSAKTLENVDDGGGGLERVGTLPVPGPDGALGPRSSFEFTANPPRRSITTLVAREEGESGREHAARIMQKLDLHRKATFSSAEAVAGSGGAGGSSNLITTGQSFLPGYSATSQPASATTPGQSRFPNLPLAIDPHRPGSLAPITMAKPPVPTNLSKAAVVAGSTVDPSRGLPTVLLANFWGSSAMMSNGPATAAPQRENGQDTSRLQVAGTPTTEKPPLTPGIAASMHRKTASVDAKVPTLRVPDAGRPVVDVFPLNYPPELKAQYVQFRLLFPSVAMDEKPVLVFNAAWTGSSSSEGREGQRMSGNGRIFVTADNMYFYGHHMGLVTAYTIALDTITEATAAPGRECDYIFLHLSQNMNDMGLSRITIKVFLEDFSLLHARLNLLVDDLQAEEPMDFASIITALLNLEGEDDKKSPSAESWEEVSANTPIDDGTMYGRPVSRRVGDLSRRYRSHGHNDSISRGHHRKALHHPKLQLPSHPVVYEPEDMGRCVAERHFETSSKSCFHVLFGDKSFIFPKLYFERRAKEIAQGPWELQDHGKMVRQFKFKVDYVDMLGRSKPGNVTDTQVIDIFNEHITYVVTHIKTPWHLPHSQQFKLVTKVVITHVAKSKCKLAIYTKADWSKEAAFAKSIVQRQALNDAANDAEELAEVATDQVRKLGPHSRTKRAIQVYGNIGQQNQVVVFQPAADTNDGAKKGSGANIRPRTLTDMMLETGRSFLESAITSVMMWAFAAVKRIFKIISANRVILVMLMFSAAYNLVVVSQSGSKWWVERKAARYMNHLGVGPNLIMSKAIYVRDLEEAALGTALDRGVEGARPVGSQCYDAFQSMVNTTDPDAPYSEAGAGLLTTTSKATARRLRRTRQRLGGYRHDLLVAMRVVNGIEREMMQSEWENWLWDENARCEQAKSRKSEEEGGDVAAGIVVDRGDAKQKPLVMGGGGKGKDANTKSNNNGYNKEDKRKQEALRAWYDEYCGSCVADRKNLIASARSRESMI
ncbi:hypothetical protein QBC37DRAFT_306631 [Rhypophila decipiens]|uniref:PH domain-containing protein n=1 Tax=Rhypophila decipiens TaxID=261697 RepID=A0AAN6YHA2_9PEZI|nr:hypothetical protein QBC37DRAFT_306631 [Rhypophila decipiens]